MKFAIERARLLECLDTDYRRMREVVSGADLAAQVPSCPGWTVTNLVEHTACVYLHKVEATRLGREPEEWPPDLSGGPPLESFEDAYAKLTDMFATHHPSDHSGTWYDPDQTVGFWIRRMAQETVIHRRDAELAVADPTPAPDDLAIDGIAELLDIFVAYPTHKWSKECAPVLEPADGDSALVVADAAQWLAEIRTTGVDVTRTEGVDSATVCVTGPPSAVLFWLWNRWDASDGRVDVSGDDDAVERLRALLTACTQ